MVSSDTGSHLSKLMYAASDLLQQALDTVESCPCKEGCAACEAFAMLPYNVN